MGYSLRNERWRYTEWIQSGTKKVVARELYDHRDTQLPQRNLADEAEQAELVAQLSKQLDAAQRVEGSKVYKKK
jgi:iduronate 2-sulfatase